MAASILTATAAQVGQMLQGIAIIINSYTTSDELLFAQPTLFAFQNTQTLLQPYSATGIINYALNSTQVIDFNNMAGVIGNLQNLGVTLTYQQSVAAAGQLTQIQNANTANANVDNAFPYGANTVTYNDSYFICEQPGTNQFFISQPGSGFYWAPLEVTTLESQGSDTVLAVTTFEGEVVAFGAQSLQYYQDTGVAVSGVIGTTPYQAGTGLTQNWGLAAIYSVAQFNGGVAFLGQNLQGPAQVMWIAPGTAQPQPISTTDIANMIGQVTQPAAALGQSYYVDGHPMYEITFPLDSLSLLYDGLTQVWSVLQSGVGTFGRHMTNFAWTFNGSNFVSDQATGNLYLMDVNNFTENGNPIKRQLRTRHITNGGANFAVAEMWLNMDTGDAPQPPAQGSTPNMMCSVSTDYGATYSYERWFPMGGPGLYYERVGGYEFGMARDFVFQFTVTDPVPFVISSAFATIVPGTERQ